MPMPLGGDDDVSATLAAAAVGADGAVRGNLKTPPVSDGANHTVAREKELLRRTTMTMSDAMDVT